jgi:hypothetical protein
MRTTLAAIIVAAASCLFNASSASAALTNGAAVVRVTHQLNQVTQVAGGCGAGRHRGPRGGCIRN